MPPPSLKPKTCDTSYTHKIESLDFKTLTNSGGASAVKEPGHFEVRKSLYFFNFLSTLLPKQSNTKG